MDYKAYRIAVLWCFEKAVSEAQRFYPKVKSKRALKIGIMAGLKEPEMIIPQIRPYSLNRIKVIPTIGFGVGKYLIRDTRRE